MEIIVPQQQIQALQVIQGIMVDYNQTYCKRLLVLVYQQHLLQMETALVFRIKIHTYRQHQKISPLQVILVSLRTSQIF